MTAAERERQLTWLMTLRVVVVTTLLVSAFAVELLFSPAQTLRPLFLLAAVSYGAVLVYAVSERWLQSAPSFLLLQLVGDAVLVTFFVQITGGLDSPMSFLYLLPIVVAAMTLYRRGALIVAGASFLLYAGLVFYGRALAALGSGSRVTFENEPGRVVYHIVAHLGAMVAVAWLASYLSERLRVQSRELVERRGAVARLQALNENIIESINSGLITTDPGGRINFINRGGREILGVEGGEVEGRSIEQVLGLDDGQWFDIRRRLLTERRFRFERYLERDGAPRIFLGMALSNLHDKLGHPLGYIVIFQDLTEIHRLELEVRLSERMAALGEMAAGMAHELRNPLAAISGSVQYLKGSLRPGGETLELMDIILRESARLDQAIRDFLTFARPGEFDPHRTDLVRVFDDNVKLLAKSREFKRGHRIVTRYAGPEMCCDVDPNRIKQVFWNLATNALKGMPQGGTLLIGARWLGQDRVEIHFEDDGVGMDEASRLRYFQPFCSSFDEGTGLGAAIVYRLVQEHGGHIELDSSAGAGTRVRISLPRTQPRAAGSEAPEAARRAAGGG